MEVCRSYKNQSSSPLLKIFPKHGICAVKHKYNINFLYRKNSVNLKNPIFHPYPQFYFQNKTFPENLTSYGLLGPCQNLEKTYIKIQWKPPDKQKDRWKGGQNLSFRILLATARNPKWISKTAYLKKPLSLSKLCLLKCYSYVDISSTVPNI